MVQKLHVSRCCPNTFRVFLGGSLCQGYTYMVHLPMNSKIQKEKTSQH